MADKTYMSLEGLKFYSLENIEFAEHTGLGCKIKYFGNPQACDINSKEAAKIIFNYLEGRVYDFVGENKRQGS